MRMYGDKELSAERIVEINKECAKLPGPESLFIRQQGPVTLTYVDSVYVIDRMNAIFGVDGWCHNIEDEKLLFESESPDGKWKAAYKVTVCVNTNFGIYHADIGVGHGNSKDRGKALEGAILEAPTDALKRACRFLGKSLGLALYSELDRTEIFLESIRNIANAGDYNRMRETLGKLKPSFNDNQYMSLATAMAEKKKNLGI